ncbi:MAG: capsular polysaccharide biosynthesis protein [Lachnospiraceae bacterium]|nr:capsular polysaccharide biosynthesis protein [Lachnospiraceae bacterium]
MMGLGRRRAEEATPFYDLHCHILPGIDDGAKDAAMSAELLAEEIRQGCEGLVATPHYYREMNSISEFLIRREQAFSEMKEAIAGDFPGWERRIFLGAEVAYYPGIAQDPEIEKLCMGSSRYFLLEMPFSRWTPSVVRDVSMLMTSRGLRVILAHLERFERYADQELLDSLLAEDMLVQMNCEALLFRDMRKTALAMVSGGLTQILSTDAHRPERRPPNMREALEFLRKKRLWGEAEQILMNNAVIYRAAMGDKAR